MDPAELVCKTQTKESATQKNARLTRNANGSKFRYTRIQQIEKRVAVEAEKKLGALTSSQVPPHPRTLTSTLASNPTFTLT